MNKGELQYYDYSSIAVSSTSLLALMHVPYLVAAPEWFVWRMYGASYADINSYCMVASSGSILCLEKDSLKNQT